MCRIRSSPRSSHPVILSANENLLPPIEQHNVQQNVQPIMAIVEEEEEGLQQRRMVIEQEEAELAGGGAEEIEPHMLENDANQSEHDMDHDHRLAVDLQLAYDIEEGDYVEARKVQSISDVAIRVKNKPRARRPVQKFSYN